MKLTVAPEIVHTELADASIVKVTALPDPPPVAVTVYVAPPTFAALGAVEVNAAGGGLDKAQKHAGDGGFAGA